MSKFGRIYGDYALRMVNRHVLHVFSRHGELESALNAEAAGSSGLGDPVLYLASLIRQISCILDEKQTCFKTVAFHICAVSDAALGAPFVWEVVSWLKVAR